MKLRFTGSTSGGGGCPSVYETDRDTVVVQGSRIDPADPIRNDLRDLAEDEDVVEVPRQLLERFAPTRPTPAPSDLVTGADFEALFRDFAHTARRLETRTHYDIENERESFDQFLDGSDVDLSWFTPWLDTMREQTNAGKTVARVRVVPPKLTDYLRYELFLTEHNTRAGEDIRYLDRATANNLALPDRDFWLFDSHTLAILHFTDAGQMLGAEIVTDPAVVVEHARWLDAAFHHARRYEDFVKEHPPR
ncbi:DUF6879 family protein [Streptomyces sp. FH025]|uniref:DUF6879 family protein n=1 Tax=Streptomyces sp. FH025 TaxID=2815937 RepID=UPI001AA00175|nr:DUF6879 family protein [Streptomyces sp. FH025]MBO1417817.1 hypothetical protein [Streptomyces sp. FH025]